MKLVGTPLSHFTRKLRILFAELGVDFELVRMTSVLAPSPDAYGDNRFTLDLLAQSCRFAKEPGRESDAEVRP